MASPETSVEIRMRILRGTRLSERYPKLDCPMTCETLRRAKTRAPCVPVRPIAVAYEGRYSDGKKYPRPCTTLLVQYTQKTGDRRACQLVLPAEVCALGGNLPLSKGIKGPVSTTSPMAMMRRVV